jgi:Putative inner membrane protein (DUF1819)
MPANNADEPFPKDRPECHRFRIHPALRVYPIARFLPHPLTPSPAHSYPLGCASLAHKPELARFVAHAFLTHGDCAAAKRHVLSTNGLQAPTASSAKRVEQELRRRLQSLNHPPLELLATAPLDTRAALAWLAVLKTTPFILQPVQLQHRLRRHVCLGHHC